MSGPGIHITALHNSAAASIMNDTTSHVGATPLSLSLCVSQSVKSLYECSDFTPTSQVQIKKEAQLLNPLEVCSSRCYDYTKCPDKTKKNRMLMRQFVLHLALLQRGLSFRVEEFFKNLTLRKILCMCCSWESVTGTISTDQRQPSQNFFNV